MGSLKKATLRFANQQASHIFEQKFEIGSLCGTLSPDGVHLHIAISDRNGRTIGGHLEQGRIITEILEELEYRATDTSHPLVSTLTSSTSGPSPDLKHDQKLVSLLKDAYEAIAGEDGWAHLGAVGNQLTKLSPSFDSRNFGYKKLLELIRATNLFEIKETRHEKNTDVKDLQIKLKSAP